MISNKYDIIGFTRPLNLPPWVGYKVDVVESVDALEHRLPYSSNWVGCTSLMAPARRHAGTMVGWYWPDGKNCGTTSQPSSDNTGIENRRGSGDATGVCLVDLFLPNTIFC